MAPALLNSTAENWLTEYTGVIEVEPVKIGQLSSSQQQQYQTIKKVLNLSPGEKRINPRHDIHMLVKYRTTQMNEFDDGILCNLSQQGVMFYTLNNLAMNDNVDIMIFPDGYHELPIRVTAEVVRRDTNQDCYSSFNYGCVIKKITDPNLDLTLSANCA